MKTLVEERDGICFSIEPMATCENDEVEETESRKVVLQLPNFITRFKN